MGEQSDEPESSWLPASGAIALLSPLFNRQSLAQEAIIDNAASGLLRSRCRLRTVTRSTNPHLQDVEDGGAIDKSYWLLFRSLESRKTENWVTGDFALDEFFPTARYSSHHKYTRIYGVLFSKIDVNTLIPSNVEPTDAKKLNDTRPLVSEAELRRWYEVFSGVYAGKHAPEALAVQSAKAMFPNHSVSRDRVRDLRGAQPIGKPKNRD